MFKKLNKMKIGARLKKSFRQIILILGILSALGVWCICNVRQNQSYH